MEGKKKYFALIIFLFLGLMIFTFANPAEEEKEFKGGDKEQSETVTNKREETTEEDDEEEQEQQQDANQQQEANQQQNVTTNNNQGNAQGGNQGNNPGQTPVNPVDNTLRDALAAVEKAEGTYTQKDVDAAKQLVNQVTDTTEKGKLEERLDEVEAGIAALALLENLETQVEEALEKADMTNATSYRDTNEIAKKIEDLNNETVKETLQERLDKVSKLLDDNAAPTTKVKAKAYNDNVEITAEDEAGNPFKMYLTKGNGKEKEISSGDKTTSDGVYTLRLIDEAFNEQTVTFTVDTAAPVLKDLTNGAHYPEITLTVEDLTKTKIEVTNMDKNETTVVEDGTKLTEDATYKVVLTDEAGNTTEYWLAIDSTNPTIENVDDGSFINSATTALIKDKFLTNVVVSYVSLDGTETKEEFTRANFSVEANNENFSYEYTLDKEGTYTITAEDKIGNTSTKTVIVDMTPAKKNAVNINVNGYKNTVNEQYATNGNKISAYISINEELKQKPKFTFYANGKKIKEITDEVVISNSSNEKYPYIYTANLEINEELVAEDGLITFTVSNIYDKAGNKTEDITKITTKKVITLDRTAAARVYSTIRSNQHGEVSENGKDIDYYHTNGTKFEYAISFNELLKEAPTVTVGGRNVEMKLNEKVLKNENKFLYEGTFQIPADEAELAEGTLEIKVTNVKDLAGNETTLEDQTKTSNGRRVIYDVTPAKRMSGNIYVTGVKAIENTYYTQYGNTMYANITTNEKLLNNPTFTFHNNGKDYVAEDVIYRGLNDKGYHLYQASFKITKEIGMKDGEITFTVSNIIDLAGNKTADITGPSNRNKVFIDNAVKIDKLAIIGKNGQWKGKEYIQYANTGTTVYVNARFKEELASTPVVKLNETIELTKATKKEDNGIWIYSYSYKLKDNDGLVDGTIQVKVTNIKDYAGNTAVLTNANMTMESQSEVVVDRTLPTYRFTKAGSSLAVDEIKPIEKDGVFYFNQPVRVTLSDSVNLRLHGIDTYYDDKNANRTGWLKDVKGDGLHTAIAKDAAGNKLEFQFVVDTKEPEVVSSYETLTVEGDKTAKFKDFPIFTVTDLSGAVEEKLVSGNVDMSKVGEYKLTYEFTDFVGNKTTKTVKVNVVDTTAPVVTTKQENDIVLEAGADKYKELGAVVTDNIDDTYTLDKPSYINHYTLDGTFTGRVENVDTTTLGKYLLVYTATDANGNQSNNQLAQSKKWVIVQDTINPTLTIKKESLGTSPYYSAISFALSDSNKVDYAEVNGNKFDVTNAKYSDANYQNIKGYLAEGTNIIKLYDTAGNVTEQEFVIDWTAPVVNVKEYIGQNPYSGASFKLSDNNQIDYFELNGKKYDRTNAKYSDANHDNIKASLKNGQNKLVLYDAAGNSTTYEFELERVAPTITVSNGTIGSGPYRKLNLKLHDASGIASVVINGTKLPHTGTYVDINDGHAYTFQQGTNTVTVMDKAGNTVTKTFEVDRNTINITNMTE